MFTPGLLLTPRQSGDLTSDKLAAQINSSPYYLDVFEYPAGTSVALTDNPSSSTPSSGNTCVFSPDASILAYTTPGSPNNGIDIFDTSDWSRITTLSPGMGTIRFIEFSPDGAEFCVSGSSTPWIKRYSTSDYSVFSDPSVLPTSGGTCYATAYTPDGTKLLLAYKRPGVAMDQIAYTLPSMTQITTGIPNLGNGAITTVRVMKFNQQREQLAVGYSDGSIKVFNSDVSWSQETISDQPTTGGSGDCHGLAWNKSGSQLVVCDNGASQKVKIYNTATWSGSGTLGTSSNHGVVYDISFTDDGRFFGVSGSRLDTSTQGVMVYSSSTLALHKQIGGNFDSRAFDFN